MKLLQYSIIIAGLLTLAGCKKYLSEEPTKQVSIKTVDQLEALMDNASEFYSESNFTAAYSTDDTEILKTVYMSKPSAFGLQSLQYYVFGIGDIANQASDDLWSGEFKKIFTANLVLENIDKVIGDEAVRNQVRADAHFIRAYSNWILANHYCAPYSSANQASLGLPLKKATNIQESGKRATLKETYDFILSDIAEAQKNAKDDVDPRRTWRTSKKAISAFMSRFYLFIGDYDKSLDEANKALASTTRTLMDYKKIKDGNSRTYLVNGATIRLRYTELNDWSRFGGSEFLYWTESYYTRYVSNSHQWFIPSSSLRSVYDTQNDLRYKFIIPNGGLRMAVADPAAFRYTIFEDGSLLPEGLTVAEVMLNKAEVFARKGDVSGAMNVINLLRMSRMSTFIALTAVSIDDAITKVLQERRREMPFVMRWYDIRRFSVNNYSGDDITVTRDFFNVTSTGVDINSPRTYTLETKRYQVPINQIDINGSKGQLVQNPY